MNKIVSLDCREVELVAGGLWLAVFGVAGGVAALGVGLLMTLNPNNAREKTVAKLADMSQKVSNYTSCVWHHEEGIKQGFKNC